MSEFKPMTECKGFNMERVLLKNKNGYMITAYFKDGMLQCDGDEDWTQPIAWKGFIRLQDLANGADASENTLPIQNVCFSLPFMDLEQAEKEAMETDYACFAVGEDINTGDAGAFYLEGYSKARMLLGNES